MTNDTLAKLAADNLPDRIYLVLGEDISPDDDPRADFDELGDVTWCIDKQFENDVEYVRADLATLTAQALPAAEPAMTPDQVRDGIADFIDLYVPHREFWTPDVVELVRSIEIKPKHQAAQQAAQAPEIPAEVFDGYRVYKALTKDAEKRTSYENVSDVLDALAKLLRPAARPQPPQPQEDA